MKNPIKSLDDLLVSGANVAVYAWNFTTGRTKSDLSMLLMTAGSTLRIINSINYPEHNPPEFVVPVYTTWTVGASIANKFSEKKEVAALEKQMKDPGVELHKLSYTIWGVALGVLAINEYFASTQENSTIKNSTFLNSIADGLIAVGLYVTSANFLPPRKNCISRAWEELNEIVSSYKQKPAYAKVGN